MQRSGFEPWPGHCAVFMDFTLTVPLSTQEYKWVPVDCQGNLTKCCRPSVTSRPGGVAVLLVASCYGDRDKLQPE